MAHKLWSMGEKTRKFAELVANGVSQTDAYRQAVASPTASDQTIWENSSKLMAKPSVRDLIEALRVDAAQATGNTLVDMVNQLTEIQQGAIAAGSFGPAVAATMGKAKLLGLDNPSYRADTELKKLTIELKKLEIKRMKIEISPPAAADDMTAAEYTIRPDEETPDNPVL